ncbi:MAG: PFL family protein, partial [Atribacterota bacterium]
AGEKAFFGGLLGEATIIPVNPFQGARFILRGGRVPAPLTSLRN